jgi:AraC family transcriptional regulator
MEPRITISEEKKLIGKHLSMSFTDNRTVELWKSFIPCRKEIRNSLTSDLISMQVYDNLLYFRNFDQNAIFEKWAAVEVSDFNTIPAGMEPFTLPYGLYAVFLHKGGASTGTITFRYIFETWLPRSGYNLDIRPHFEILGEKYKNDSPDSEEEIWIPIKSKK